MRISRLRDNSPRPFVPVPMSDYQQLNTPPINLHERRITMPDGRYMIFFTFSGESGRDLSPGLHGGTADEPTALETPTSEERNV